MKRTIIFMLILVLFSCWFNSRKMDHRDMAVAFFEESGISKEMQFKYLEGMALGRKVSIDTIKKGECVVQYQAPFALQGFFYTCEDCGFNGLGIPMENRVRNLYRAVKDTKVLKSTTSNIVWEKDGQRRFLVGGNTQMFTSCIDCFELVPIVQFKIKE